MIFDSVLSTLMLKGVDRIQPEEGDSQMHLLNFVLLTTPPIQPVIQLIGSGGAGTQSFHAAVARTKTNGVVDTNTLAILEPGLYTLDFSLAARFNYTTTGNAVPDVRIEILDGATSNPIIGIYAQIGHFNEKMQYKFLLNRSFSFRLALSANGLGQTMDVIAAILVTRHL